jgi:hypothetical protein
MGAVISTWYLVLGKAVVQAAWAKDQQSAASNWQLAKEQSALSLQQIRAKPAA